MSGRADIPALFLLCLALAASGSGFAASSEKTLNESLDAAREDISRRMEELSPFAQKLELLKTSYLETNDPSRHAGERQRLIAEIEARRGPLSQQIHRFHQLKKQEELHVMLIGLASGLKPRAFLQDLGPETAHHFEWRDFYHDASSFMRGVEITLAADEAAFTAAQDACRARRRWVRASAVLLFFLVLILGVIGWKFIPRLGGGSRALAAGAVLGGNYRIEHALGGGSAFEATDLALHRKVALKRLREGRIPDRKELERFLAEARRAATLKHPNIAEIYAIFEEAGQAFLVFEFVRGETLSRRLEILRSLSLASSKDVLKQIAAALDYAHSRNVLHRNLKPSSILIDGQGAIKVMDFGAAPRSAAPRSPYTAPEQAQSGAVLRESDLFSLGVMLYEMLTGRLPGEYADLSKLVPGLPPGLDEILRRALRTDPQDRYHSGAEFAAALHKIPT